MIRILLADDQALIRSGIRSLLEAEDDIAVVAEAADGTVIAYDLAGAGPALIDLVPPGSPAQTPSTGLCAVPDVGRRSED